MGRFPYGLLPKYPHLREDEVKIWERFIAFYPDFFDRVDYDVKVGFGIGEMKAGRDVISGDFHVLKQKRIDVVGYKNAEIYIVEIKPSAKLGALGQLLGEKHLYIDTYQPDRDPFMVLITDQFDKDVQHVAVEFNIKYVTV